MNILIFFILLFNVPTYTIEKLVVLKKYLSIYIYYNRPVRHVIFLILKPTNKFKGRRPMTRKMPPEGGLRSWQIYIFWLKILFYYL